MFSGLLVGFGFGVVTHSVAAPSIWQRVKDPLAVKKAALLLRADRKREPKDATFDSPDIRVQLHRAAATWLELAGVEELGDIELLYLYGECLAYAGPQYLERAKAILQRALNEAPGHPAAVEAWYSLGLVTDALGERNLEDFAFERVLEREWRQPVRVDAFIAQGMAAISGVRLGYAIERLESARAESTDSSRWALSQWALAVAMDRSLLGPQAEALAWEASKARFGPNGQGDVLSLPESVLEPAAEVHYYRALAMMGRARVEPEATRVKAYQDARFLWLRYIDAAGVDSPWLARVRQHLSFIDSHTKKSVIDEDDLDALARAPAEFEEPRVARKPADAGASLDSDAGVDPIWPDELEQGKRFWTGDAGLP